jgi:hypothetical protein
MSFRRFGTEVGDPEFQKMSNIVWPTLAILYSIQALTSQETLSNWQITYTFGIIATIVLSAVLQKYTKFAYSYSPFVLFLLLSPAFLADLPENSWMSYGLIGVTASIYFAVIASWEIAIACVLLINVFQVWAMQQDLTSVTDLSDMRLFGGYFSTIWSLGMGFLTIIVRYQYVKASIKIEERIDRLKEAITIKLQRITRQNREDYKNLKLHGTVLNSMIYARMNENYLKDTTALLETLKREISALQTENFLVDLKSAILEMLNERVNPRILVEETKVSGYVSNLGLQKSYVELIREILLNLEKHTIATVVTINVTIDKSNNLNIEISDNSFMDLDSEKQEEILSAATRSRSLSRLLSLVPAQLQILRAVQGVMHRVTSIPNTEEIEGTIEIHKLRTAGLLGFVNNLIKSVALIGLLYIPGYFFIQVGREGLIFLVLQVITLVILAFKKSISPSLLFSITTLAISTPIVVSRNITQCSQIAFAPWMANIVLASTFLFALLSKNRYLRWIPLGIFTLELLLLPANYPEACQNIFVGTLPGIPLIVAIYLVITSLRRRAFEMDAHEIRSVYEDDAKIEQVKLLLNEEFTKLLDDLEHFVDCLETDSSEDIIANLDLAIQKVRAYLICSEQFESRAVRDFYDFAIDRLRRGIPNRISILGDSFFEVDRLVNLKDLFIKMDQVLGNENAQISLLRIDGLSIEVVVEDEELTQQLESLNSDLSSNNLVNIKAKSKFDIAV